MYPPKITDSLDECVANLMQSLLRGGDCWSGEVSTSDRGNGCTNFALHLKTALPPHVHANIAGYVRGYIRKCGWKVAGVRVIKRYVEVSVSNI